MMKPFIPLCLILLPTLCALSLFIYSIISDRWISIDEERIKMSSAKLSTDIPEGLTLLTKRIAFIKHFGLFSRCIDYRWLDLVYLNSSETRELQRLRSYRCGRPCHSGEVRCGRCCVPERMRCDNVPECDSMEDEFNCPRLFGDRVWLDNRRRCFKEKTNILSLHNERRKLGDHPSAGLLHGIMVWLFISAALVQLVILLMLIMIIPCRKHLSIPFTFITTLCVLGFMCGAVGIGLFLWNWAYKLSYSVGLHCRNNQQFAPSILLGQLNPWLAFVEVFDVAFYVACAGVLFCLLSSTIGILFFCGIVGSRMSFNSRMDDYQVLKILPFDDKNCRQK